MSDSNAKPSWYGTATRRNASRRRKPRAAKTLFTTATEQDKADLLDATRRPSALEGRAPNGHFARHNQLAPPSPALLEAHKLKRKFKQCVDDDYPGLMQETIAELRRIALEGESDRDKLSAIAMLHNRYWGRPVEHKHIKRTGTSDANINVLLGDLAWMDDIKDPEARIILAARIHGQQLAELEQNVIDVNSVEIPNGQPDDSEVQARPQPDDGGIGPAPGPVAASGIEIDV